MDNKFGGILATLGGRNLSGGIQASTHFVRSTNVSKRLGGGRH